MKRATSPLPFIEIAKELPEGLSLRAENEIQREKLKALNLELECAELKDRVEVLERKVSFLVDPNKPRPLWDHD